MHRRTFVKTIAKKGAALTAGACLWPPLFNGCTTVKWVAGEKMESGIGLSMAQLRNEKFVILDNPGLGGPVGITLDGKGVFYNPIVKPIALNRNPADQLTA